VKRLVLIAILLSPILSQGQDSAAYWKSEYVKYAEEYRISEALRCAEKWVKSDSLDQTAWFELSKAYLQKGKVAAAERTLQKLLKTDTSNVAALNQLARLQMANNQNDAAIVTFERLMAIDSTNPYYTKKAAELYVQSPTRPWMARKYYDKTLELDSLDLGAYLGLAQFWMDGGAFYPADLLLTKALEIDSTSQAARILAAKSAHLQDDPEDVIRLLEGRTFDAGYIVQAARYYGISLYKTGAYQDAIDAIAMVPMVDPEADYPHYYTGLCHLALGNPSEAAEEFELAVEKATSPNLMMYHKMLGGAYQQTGDHKNAITHLRQAEFLGSESDLLYNLAVSYDAFYADKSMAINTFTSYLETDTTDSERAQYARERVKTLQSELHFKEPEK
jgi:tetratricopeptide (TPR) repeat protein